jgi:hypothetical protein
VVVVVVVVVVVGPKADAADAEEEEVVKEARLCRRGLPGTRESLPRETLPT